MGKYFGTDGFRGEAGIDLTADHAYKVGRFLGWYYNALRERNGNNEPARIVIGKDSDDTLKNNAIEVLLQTAQKTNADITICSCRHIKEKNKGNANCDAEQRCLKTVESSEAVKKLSYNVHVFEELEPTAVWGKLYKKAVVQNLRFNENMNIGEDFVFNYFANTRSRGPR